MTERVSMPALGESVTEGTVTRWLKQVGDVVAVDEPLLEVSTDKVDTEIPSPVAGVLQEILVGEDETVPVGTDLAVLGEGRDASTPPATASPESTPAPAPTPGPTSQPPAPEPASAPQQPQPADTDQPQRSPGPPPAAEGEGTAVTMPALGESVTEGTVTRWLKAQGDRVEVDEPLLEVSTDKVDTEIPSPVAGTLRSILVAEDTTVPVGATLALVGTDAAPTAPAAPAAPNLADAAAEREAEHQQAAEQSSPSAQPAQAEQTRQATPAPNTPAPPPAAQEQSPATVDAPAPAANAPSQEPAATPAPASGTEPAPGSGANGGDASAYVTPLVRKLASEQGVDLSALTGTGVGGRIRKQDVLDAAERARAAAAQQAAQQAAPAQPTAARTQAAPGAHRSAGTDSLAASISAKRGTTEKMSRLRKVIAQRMVESLHTSAQLTTVVEVDVTKIARLRERAKRDFEAREGVKLSFLPFFALAAVEALKANPTVNASVEGDQILYHAQENLGIAVDTERGLLVPVIRDAGDLNIPGLARKVADLAERTRNNKITPDELGGGTFTLTNTGSRGALFDTPIINQPQVAILGTGAVVRRAVVVSDADGGETIAIRSMVYLALSYDHRIVDGADAARFLVCMKERLQEGAFDADLGL